MPEPGYLVAALLTAGAITVALRAVPFLALHRLRESAFVARLGQWMPAGVLTILALATLVQSADGARLIPALVAAAVTVAMHLLGGRRSLLSIGAGTATYVVALQLL